jgi:hypothetical protein
MTSPPPPEAGLPPAGAPAAPDAAAPETPDAGAGRALLALIGGYRATQMIAVAARLGIADRLAGWARSAPDLARAAGADPDALRRLLSALVNLGLLAEDGEGRFALTALGGRLRTDVPGSLRAWAIWEGVTSYGAWRALDESVATGRTAFDRVFGLPFFAYFAAHPEVGGQFDAAMTDFTAGIAAAVAAEYDFAGRRTVVDVGGGRGHVLAAVLQTHPLLEGILFDLPGVVPAAIAYLAGAGLAGRARIVAGDFFTAVPPGADLYVLCHIVHDWDDARAIRILQTCRAAVAPEGSLLIVEKYMPEPMVPGAVPSGTDVNMLVLTGGRERTEREYRALLAAGGWRLTRVLPTSSVSSIFEASPA